MPCPASNRSSSPESFANELEPQRVDLLRAHGRRGLIVRGEPVVVSSVGQLPDARIGTGARPPAAQKCDLPVERRAYRTRDDPGRSPAPVTRNLLRRGAPDQRLDQPTILGQRLSQGAHLDQGLVDDEIRRHHAGGPIGRGPGRLIIHHARKFVQAREVPFRILVALHSVLCIEKIGHRLVGTGDLAQLVRRREGIAPIAERLIALERERDLILNHSVVRGRQP